MMSVAFQPMGEQVTDALQTLRQIEADFLTRLGRVVATLPDGETLVFGNRWRQLVERFGPGLADWVNGFPQAVADDVAELGAITAPVNTGLPTAEERLTALRATLQRPQVLQVLRGTQSRLQALQARLAAPALVGDETVRQVTERFVRDVAARGPFEFVDRAGRSWDLDAYADTSSRTLIAQTETEVRLSDMRENGATLGRVSDSPLECPICRPWEGRIVSIGNAVEGYPSLRSAVRAGLFHPNCTHSVEGVTGDEPSDETPERDPEGFQLLQTQRRLERRSRVLQREQALWPKGSDDYREAGRKRRAVRARIQGLVDADPGRLRRRTERERLIRR